jgi:hypothetical protein
MAHDKKKVVFYGPRKKKFGHHWYISYVKFFFNVVLDKHLKKKYYLPGSKGCRPLL